jgi:hypothetical protein
VALAGKFLGPLRRLPKAAAYLGVGPADGDVGTLSLRISRRRAGKSRFHTWPVDGRDCVSIYLCVLRVIFSFLVEILLLQGLQELILDEYLKIRL